MVLNECIIYHMKVHIFSYNLGQRFFSKSRIHILPNYEQTDSKTAIVGGRGQKFAKYSSSKKLTTVGGRATSEMDGPKDWKAK